MAITRGLSNLLACRWSMGSRQCLYVSSSDLLVRFLFVNDAQYSIVSVYLISFNCFFLKGPKIKLLSTSKEPFFTFKGMMTIYIHTSKAHIGSFQCSVVSLCSHMPSFNTKRYRICERLVVIKRLIQGLSMHKQQGIIIIV